MFKRVHTHIEQQSITDLKAGGSSTKADLVLAIRDLEYFYFFSNLNPNTVYFIINNLIG